MESTTMDGDVKETIETEPSQLGTTPRIDVHLATEEGDDNQIQKGCASL